VVTATNLGLRSSDLEPTQRRRTACGQDLVVVVGVKGGGEKFSDGEILKTTTVGPLQYDDYYTVLSRAPVRSNMDAQFSITSLKTPMESIDDLTSTNGRARINERANIRPLLTPRAIARGACGHSPYYRNTTERQLDNPVRFSLSPLNGVVPLERA